MKIDHITTREMERFCGGLLTMSEVIAYSEHLEGCEECSRLYDSISKVITCVRPLSLEAARDAWHIGDHPELEELADFAAGDLDDEDNEIIEGHLANCERCRREVDDYAAFLQSIEPEMAITFRPQNAIERRWRTLGREFSKLPVFLPVSIAALLLMTMAILAYQAYFNDETTSPITRDQPGNLVSPPSSPLPSVTATPDRTPLQLGVDQSDRTTAAAGGSKYRDKQAGTEHLPAPIRTLVASALSPKGLEKPAIVDSLKTRAVTYRRAATEATKLEIVGPAGTVLLTDQPMLIWKSAEGVRSYRVVVTDLNFNVVAESPWMSDTRWELPSPLARDKVYLWQLKGKSGDEETDRDPVAEARFKILSATGEARLRELRRNINSPLVLALVMAGEGLLDDAEQELKKVDHNSASARDLSRNIRQWRSGSTVNSMPGRQ